MVGTPKRRKSIKNNGRSAEEMRGVTRAREITRAQGLASAQSDAIADTAGESGAAEDARALEYSDNEARLLDDTTPEATEIIAEQSFRKQPTRQTPYDKQVYLTDDTRTEF